jgi:hypothetical protein
MQEGNGDKVKGGQGDTEKWRNGDKEKIHYNFVFN